MICDYDIKFVNKEITPFGGFSLFLKMLERCHFCRAYRDVRYSVPGLQQGLQAFTADIGHVRRSMVWCKLFRSP